MRLLDVKVHVLTEIGKTPTTITLTAKFEDMVENWPVELTLNDLVYVNSGDIRTVFNEIERISSDHPFFKLQLCESPIELKFFVYSISKIPNLKPQVVVGPIESIWQFLKREWPLNSTVTSFTSRESIEHEMPNVQDIYRSMAGKL